MVERNKNFLFRGTFGIAAARKVGFSIESCKFLIRNATVSKERDQNLI
jgi:hypothetical protein